MTQCETSKTKLSCILLRWKIFEMFSPKSCFIPSTSFSFPSGTMNASLKLKLAATDRTGSRQENIAPIRIIFPVWGSNGSWARWNPSGVNSSPPPLSSKALMVLKVFKERRTASILGGSRTFWRNWEQVPSSRSLICRITSSRLVLQISGGRYDSSNPSLALVNRW